MRRKDFYDCDFWLEGKELRMGQSERERVKCDIIKDGLQSNWHFKGSSSTVMRTHFPRLVGQ
jgi:hypothetical protein